MTPPRRLDARGFTLAEVLIATAAMTIIGAAAFALLSTSLDNHGILSRTHREVTHSAHIMEMIRAEVATASSLDLAQNESLLFTTSSGDRVLYLGATQPDGSIAFNRHTIDGAGNVQDTMYLASLHDGEDQAASLVFTSPGPDRVAVRMVSSDFATRFTASRWTEP